MTVPTGFANWIATSVKKPGVAPNKVMRPRNLHTETLSAVNAQCRHEREHGGVVNIKQAGTNLGLLMETLGSVAAAVRASRTEGLSADLYRLAARALAWAERLDEAQARALQREQRALRKEAEARTTSASATSDQEGEAA